MEASARDGLWSVRRRNVSARPISVSPFVPFSRCGALILKKKFDFFPLFFFFFFSNQHQYCQLSGGRDLGRDRCDQDGHACIREDDARETRAARADSPSTLQ